MHLGPFFCALLLLGCSSSSIPMVTFDSDDEVEEMTLTIEVSEDINPNESSRPSPLVITIYQLSSDINFNRASPYELLQNDSGALGVELKSRNQITLLPGQSQKPELNVVKGTQFLGFLGAFQDLDHARAKVVYKIDASDPDDICLSVAGKNINAKTSC